MTSKYFYKGIDISTLISTTNEINGNSNVAVVSTIPVTNRFIGFPNISDSVLQNGGFDLSFSLPSGYRISDTDIRNVLPTYVKIYKAGSNTGNILLSNSNPINNTNYANATLSFNNTTTFNFTVPSVVNKMGFILSGAGGGGGGSSYSNNIGTGGGGGGGGGCCYGVLDVNHANVGRSFTVTVGAGGKLGVNAGANNYGFGNTYTGGTGGVTSIYSNINSSIIANANGGIGGDSPGAGGLGGNASINVSSPALISGNSVPRNNTNLGTATLGINTGGWSNVANQGADAWPRNTGNGPTLPGGNPGYYNVWNTMPKCFYLQPTTNGLTLTAFNSTSGTVASNPNNVLGIPAGGNTNNSFQTANTSVFNNPLNCYGAGGGAAAQNNGGNATHPGAPGAPGIAIIYYYIS